MRRSVGQFSCRSSAHFYTAAVTNPAGFAPADDSVPKLRASAFRVLCNGALFLTVCIAGCALLGWMAPFPEVPGIFPKWAWFKKHRDQFDVLFLGSSRFYHQIIPKQFDAAVTAAVGAPVHSFNFGYDGMWPPESYYLLRRILALRPARLKWVVIDLMDINTQLDERNNSTMRMSYWHDTRHARLAFTDILSTRRLWPDKINLLLAHGGLWFREAINLGRGAELLNARLAPRPARKKPYSWEDHAGYEAEPERPMSPNIHAEFLAGVDLMKRRLAPEAMRPVFRDALREVIADVRRAGAEPIFVIAPTINPRENFTEIPAGAAVWAFNNPLDHPVLYEPERHYDSWHLNQKGAVDFTALLATRFVERTRAAR